MGTSALEQSNVLANLQRPGGTAATAITLQSTLLLLCHKHLGQGACPYPPSYPHFLVCLVLGTTTSCGAAACSGSMVRQEDPAGSLGQGGSRRHQAEWHAFSCVTSLQCKCGQPPSWESHYKQGRGQPH